MAKPPVGKEPTDQAAGQWSGEQLRSGHDESAEEGGSRGGESKRSPSDREVQEQSLDLRGGKLKKKKKGRKGQWDLKGRSLGGRPLKEVRALGKPWEQGQSLAGHTHSHWARWCSHFWLRAT